MDAQKLTAKDLAHIQELARGWGKIIVRQHWGEHGPGLDVTLSEMEDVAIAAVRALLAGTLEVATQKQASHLGSQQACPDCGAMCPLQHEERPIVVRTGSTFEHHEPKAHCPACRRDFFPSTPTPETGHTRLQPLGSEQNRPGSRSGKVVSSGRKGSRRRR
jgi:hypothetical protein